MTHSALTNAIRLSSQHSDRLGTPVDMMIWHGQASTNNEATIKAMVTGSKLVSANYCISSEGVITLVVDERFRAFTSGSSSDGGKGARFDRRAITVEVENMTGAPGWGFSQAAMEALARLSADVAQRYGFPLYRLTNLIGHRELWTLHRASYPTACPQSLDMDWVANRAREVNGLGPALQAIVTVTPAGQVNINFGFGLTKAAQLAAQQALARLGRYTGDQDGVFGMASVSAFQKWLKDNGYLQASYVVDGKPGTVYGLAVQTLATKFGYTLDMDGRPGAATSVAISAWAATVAPTVPQIIEAPSGADWSYWEPTGPLAARLQQAMKDFDRLPDDYVVDGKLGKVFRIAVQNTLRISGRFVGRLDGVIERGGCYGIQQYAHDFGDYTGDIDGAPRENSWIGFALGLERR